MVATNRSNSLWKSMEIRPGRSLLMIASQRPYCSGLAQLALSGLAQLALWPSCPVGVARLCPVVSEWPAQEYVGEKSLSTQISFEILTIPGWSKNWLGVFWGAPGDPLGSLGGPLGGRSRGNPPRRMIPRLSKPIFGLPGDDPGEGPRVAPDACKWVQMLANCSWGSEIFNFTFF